MIIVRFQGGLGNQLFQYAVGRWLSLKYNTELKLDLLYANPLANSHARYRLSAYNIAEKFATAEEIASINPDSWIMMTSGLKPMHEGDNVYIHGWWMNDEKFFIEIGDIIRQEFTLKNPLGQTSSMWREKILAAECSVSLHVRLGDFLETAYWTQRICPLDYHIACINELRKDFPQLKVFVFSNNVDYARRGLKLDVPMEFVTGCESDLEEFHLISLCQHNINTISTFGWWAAWLNNNPAKKIFVPDFMQHTPASWIRIPRSQTYIELHPFLSAILYIDSDDDSVDIVLSSIIATELGENEIIIVNATENPNGKYINRFKAKEHVTILNVGSGVGKFAAFNRGIESARGDYVLFLTAKDFLTVNAKYIINAVWQYNIRNFIASDEFLIMYRYIEFFANVICFTQHLEEVDNGNIKIVGQPDIADKVFNIVVDAPFNDLNVFADAKIDDRQKLMLLASGQLNNDLGTKFFKRNFLNEHGIRFDAAQQQGGGVLY